MRGTWAAGAPTCAVPCEVRRREPTRRDRVTLTYRPSGGSGGTGLITRQAPRLIARSYTRPFRMAVVLRTPVTTYAFRQAVRSLCATWGGARSLVISGTRAAPIADQWLPLLKAFDPDAVFLLVHSAAPACGEPWRLPRAPRARPFLGGRAERLPEIGPQLDPPITWRDPGGSAGGRRRFVGVGCEHLPAESY